MSIVNWDKVDQPFSGLSTDASHAIEVRREAIPLVFVPGIMGTHLRLKGTSGEGFGADGWPNMRWNPSSLFHLLLFHHGMPAAVRKKMLVGKAFSSEYLEVDDSAPAGDGFHGVMEDYWKDFLAPLKRADWGPLKKVFEFPVYAVGYNWTDDNTNSGKRLGDRIKEIIKEAKGVTGFCEQVILITHSMGGLVARAASELSGAQGSILGIVHGVQPATGAPAAYWRIKAGFEAHGLNPKNYISSDVLGPSGREVTPLLGNMPGGLQLLPTRLHKNNKGGKQWLAVTEHGHKTLSLPKSDPYEEIYEVPAVVRTSDAAPAGGAYWGLVDPKLLDPGNMNTGQQSASKNNALDARHNVCRDPWGQYRRVLGQAETFHEKLKLKHHPRTFCFKGTKLPTADVVELKVESNWVQFENYPVRGFRGLFKSREGKSMQAVLQGPGGDGDGTVPSASAAALAAPGKPVLVELDFPEVEHQPAYGNALVQAFTRKAVIALVKMRYKKLRP